MLQIFFSVFYLQQCPHVLLQGVLPMQSVTVLASCTCMKWTQPECEVLLLVISSFQRLTFVQRPKMISTKSWTSSVCCMFWAINGKLCIIRTVETRRRVLMWWKWVPGKILQFPQVSNLGDSSVHQAFNLLKFSFFVSFVPWELKCGCGDDVCRMWTFAA